MQKEIINDIAEHKQNTNTSMVRWFSNVERGHPLQTDRISNTISTTFEDYYTIIIRTCA